MLWLTIEPFAEPSRKQVSSSGSSFTLDFVKSNANNHALFNMSSS